MRNHRGGEKIAGNLMMNEAVAIPPPFLFPLISTDTPCTNTANRRAPRERERDRDKERGKKENKSNALPPDVCTFDVRKRNL